MKRGGAFVKKCRKNRRRKREAAAGGAVLLLLMIVFVQPGVHIGVNRGNEEISKIDIHKILSKSELNRSDYVKLFQQTGLGKAAVDQMRRGANENQEDILAFQERFLYPAEPECRSGSLITKQDVLKKGERGKLVSLEDGDVLLSFSSHSLGWRHGHAGLVVDSQKELCLEAACPGSQSDLKTCSHWEQYSDFLVLRLAGASAEQRRQIALYAREHLIHIPYSLTCGLLWEKQQPEDAGAQCAYLIWAAYRHFGYDVDSDGGRLVTVKDLAGSSAFEAVQIFGLNPDLFCHTLSDND